MCKGNKCVIPMIISIILGFIAGVLFYTGTIAAALIQVPIIFATAFAGISLILLYVGIVFATKKETKECICDYGSCLLLGGIGSIFTGFFGLTVVSSLAATSAISAILVGLIGFFLVLNFLSIIDLFLCLIKDNCKRKYGCFQYIDNE